MSVNPRRRSQYQRRRGTYPGVPARRGRAWFLRGGAAGSEPGLRVRRRTVLGAWAGDGGVGILYEYTAYRYPDHTNVAANVFANFVAIIPGMGCFAPQQLPRLFLQAPASVRITAHKWLGMSVDVAVSLLDLQITLASFRVVLESNGETGSNSGASSRGSSR